jgi:hypothetical protein
VKHVTRCQWGGGILLAFVVGLAPGFGLARLRSPAVVVEPTVVARRPSPLNPSVQLPTPSVVLPEGFAGLPGWQLEEHGSPEQQLRAALAWAERVPASQISGTIRSLEKHKLRTNEALGIAKAFLSARWAEIDPEAAAGECSRILTLGGSRVWIDPWAGFTALAAAKPTLAVEATRGGAVGEIAKSAVFELSRKDPELAWQLYQSSGRQPWMAAALVQSLWLRDRSAAQQLARELGQKGPLARLWAGEAPAEAFAWGVEGTIRKEDLIPLRETAGQWAMQDLAGCRHYFDALPAGPARDAMLTPLVTQIGREDWRAGANWLLAQPPSEGRAQTLAQIINARSPEDPQGVSTILQTLPPSAERDVCIQKFVEKATVIDPAAAMNWIGSISDTRKAANLADHQFGNWVKKDAAAATEWLRSSPYATPAMRAKWLKE